ncbi:MAG: hypothetical protein IJ737_06095 [Ruminococcus sp.]|nr:hypothetical protein [Ruminococcus sp.]
MKKLLAAVLALTMCAAMTACGDKEDSKSDSAATTTTTAAQAAETGAPAEDTAPEADPAEAQKVANANAKTLFNAANVFVVDKETDGILVDRSAAGEYDLDAGVYPDAELGEALAAEGFTGKVYIFDNDQDDNFLEIGAVQYVGADGVVGQYPLGSSDSITWGTFAE